jgi:hypothetical protein
VEQERAEEEARVRLAQAKLASREEIEMAFSRLDTMSPLEVMLTGMHLKLGRGDIDGAVKIAEAAGPYTAPKLTASEVRVQQIAPRPDDEVAAEIRTLREKLERARSAPQITIEATAEPAECIRSDEGINNSSQFTEQQNQQLSDAEIG